MLVSLATGAVKESVRFIFFLLLVVSVPVDSGVPVVPVVPVGPVIVVLSAEPESVLIDSGVRVAWLVAVGVAQDPVFGKLPERAVVPHAEYAVDPVVVALRTDVSPLNAS